MKRLALLLAALPLTAASAQYYCVAPPMICNSLTLLTSWQYSRDHLVVNGYDYGRAPGSVYAVPNSIVLRDVIFSSRFE